MIKLNKIKVILITLAFTFTAASAFACVQPRVETPSRPIVKSNGPNNVTIGIQCGLFPPGVPTPCSAGLSISPRQGVSLTGSLQVTQARVVIFNTLTNSEVSTVNDYTLSMPDNTDLPDGFTAGPGGIVQGLTGIFSPFGPGGEPVLGDNEVKVTSFGLYLGDGLESNGWIPLASLLNLRPTLCWIQQ